MKIGAVPYLNALPLCRYLPFPVQFETPAVLERLLADGVLDMALLPSFAFLKNPDYLPLYDGGVIQSQGAVESVMLFYRKEIGAVEKIRSLAVTPDSVTSVALLKVLFRFKWKMDSPPKTAGNDNSPDAILKIGDAALFYNDPAYRGIDLGEEWTSWTGLPFIYALWVSRKPGKYLPLLTKARLEGMERIEEIIATNRDLPQERLRTYLTKSIQYEITPSSLQGLALFKNYCLQAGLLK